MSPGKGRLSLVPKSKLRELHREILHFQKVYAARKAQVTRLKGVRNNFRGRMLPILQAQAQLLKQTMPPTVDQEKLLAAARIRMQLGKKFQRLPLPSIGETLA